MEMETTPCIVAARGMGRTVQAPRRSTKQRYLMSWKLMILDLMSQLRMLAMMKRLARTHTRMMRLMSSTWMWCDTKWMVVAFSAGMKSGGH